MSRCYSCSGGRTQPPSSPAAKAGGGSASSGHAILGYRYTFKGESRIFLKRREAIQEQIRNGGGTIVTEKG